ncbi:37S ribosomal protein MRP13 mitochondrial [Bienertia sinuspersici]
MDSAQTHSNEFLDWFKERIASKLNKGQEVLEHVKWLTMGPLFVAKKYSGYFVNGYRFYTMKRETNHVMQNSGVCLSGLTHNFSSSKCKNPTVGNVMYYGSLITETTDDQLTSVNKNKTICNGEPFILASQARQMKTNSTKAAAKQRELTKYEKKRFETMRKNMNV